MTAAAKIPVAARQSGQWFSGVATAINEAVAEYDFSSKPDFQPLADLSGATEFDGFDIDADSAVVAGSRWSVPATVYVTLVYDPSSTDPVTLNDAYPCVIHFEVKGDVVSVTSIEVDVQSFYD
jgi:hypothetical protein